MATLAVLVATRVPQLRIKQFLTDGSPAVSIDLGALGKFESSSSLVFKLKGIFDSDVSWVQRTLYIPGLIPFILVSILCLILFRTGREKSLSVFSEAYKRVKLPSVALFGALAFVSMLMLDGENSCAMKIGQGFAALAGSAWLYCSPFLGALGAFFAGSNTVSNLTFSGIQASIAGSLKLDVSTIIALQSAGGAMGNMVCIHNIVAVCSVLGLSQGSGGRIIRSTFLPMLAYGVIAALVGRLILGVCFHHL